MRFVELSPTTWNENCRTCQVANRRVIQEPGDIITVRPESLYSYLKLVDRPIPKGFTEQSTQVTGELWFCPSCETLWDVNGQWHYSIECLWNGEFTQSNEVINMPCNIVEIPPQPSPSHTLCTCCNIWREIISTDIVYEGTLRKVARTHRCPKCCIADTLTQDEPEVQEMIKQFSPVSRELYHEN